MVAAAEAARELAPGGDVTPLPRPDAGSDGPVAHTAATAGCTPELRAGQVGTVAAVSAMAGLEAFGALQTSLTQTAIANSQGVRRHATNTAASLICVARGENGWGYADRHHHDVRRLDPEKVAQEAIETCGRNQRAVALDPGVYPVVLSPYAVADLVGHLADLGFSALAHQEHRSFMRPGEGLMSELVSITDDAGHPDAMPFPFDDEGVSTRGVTCIEEGVCRSFVHDSATALREDIPSTGHALPMPNTFGPWARHLVVAAGESSLDDLIAACDHGLYVTRLWYVRDVNPLRTVITGMTRDGTFLIENGRLGRPVRDLRFTQSIVDALSDVRGSAGRDRSNSTRVNAPCSFRPSAWADSPSPPEAGVPGVGVVGEPVHPTPGACPGRRPPASPARALAGGSLAPPPTRSGGARPPPCTPSSPDAGP